MDKEAKIEEKYPQIVLEKLTTGDWMYWQIDNINDIDRKNQVVVVCSDNPSNGLPLLPKAEDWNKDLEKAGLFFVAEKIAFVKGWQAASSKKYSEEDMGKAIVRAFLFGQSHPLYGSINSLYIIQSLHPQPKQVVIEMEERQFSYSGAFKAAMDNNEEMIVPKLNTNGYVIVKQWIYETGGSV